MMNHVKMLNVHRWHRTWPGIIVEPDTIGELEGIKDGLLSVLWPGQVKPVLCLPNTVELVEESVSERRSDEDSTRSEPHRPAHSGLQFPCPVPGRSKSPREATAQALMSVSQTRLVGFVVKLLQ